MNLSKLYEMQKKLHDHIGYNEPDRFNKLILALLVELGECANEWRGFKFWSRNQEPRIYVEHIDNLAGIKKIFNPLLEEYVDGLHFVLELGLDLGFQIEKPFLVHIEKVEDMFLKVYLHSLQLKQAGGRSHKEFYYEELFSNFLGLGKALGFTWDQIERAYIEKNAKNHQRQVEGY